MIGAAPKQPPILPFFVMTVGVFIALLDIQIVASSLRDIGGGLSAGEDEVRGVQTAYLIAEIIVIPLCGWLTRVFSTRWLFTFSAGGFTLASLLCGAAWDIHSMILFRALQGLLGASMIPLVSTASFHYFPGKRRIYSTAITGAVAAMAPTLGPVIGGWITDTLNWRWLFYINLVPGIMITVLIPMLVRVDKPDLRQLRGADYPGMILMAIGLGTLEYVLEDGTRLNWFDDETIRLCGWVVGGSLLAFVVRSLTYHNPVVDLRALSNRNFALGCILSFVTGMGVFTTVYLTPLFLGYVRGYSAGQTGAAVFSTGVGVLLGTPVYIFLARKVDIRLLMMGGLACFSLSMWNFTGITNEWGSTELLIPQLLRGFPHLFAVSASVSIGLGSLPPERLKYASGLFTMARNLGGAVGIAFSAAIINDQTNAHFQRIAAHLTPANDTVNRLMTGLSGRYGDLRGQGDGHQAALDRLWQLAFREASTLAFADAFRAVMVILAVATLLVLFLHKVGVPQTAPSRPPVTGRAPSGAPTR
jgi:MFS transporter, DHA2 family, multidrug resistance protein